MSKLQNYQQQLLQAIKAETRQISLMEVCGTHTMAIAKVDSGTTAAQYQVAVRTRLSSMCVLP